MKILLVGYGKMGKNIEGIARERGHEIAGIVDQNNIESINEYTSNEVDAAIEFTQPDSAYNNLTALMKNSIPTVCGTTGWLDKRDDIEKLCQQHQAAFFYASNFSVGVNLFFAVNNYLAKLMNRFEEYDVSMKEIHHIHKLDAPSGTAVTLAEGILENLKRKNNWILDESGTPQDLTVHAERTGEVPGTHIVTYNSPIDTIDIKHEAHSRKGFATGAVLAAEYIAGKQGIFGMNDLLNL